MKMNRPKGKGAETGVVCGGKILNALAPTGKNRMLHVVKSKNGDGSRLSRWLQMKNVAWGCHLITVPTASGRCVRVLVIFDEETEECLRTTAADEITIENILDELFNVFLHRGIPRRLVAFDDNE